MVVSLDFPGGAVYKMIECDSVDDLSFKRKWDVGHMYHLDKVSVRVEVLVARVLCGLVTSGYIGRMT